MVVNCDKSVCIHNVGNICFAEEVEIVRWECKSFKQSNSTGEVIEEDGYHERD